ncbi:Uncharacterised protein [uncultured archaeon]|nr:Uncharacterised protein [uncultured archaeon]
MVSSLIDQLQTQLVTQIGQENLDKFAAFMNLSPKTAIMVLAFTLAVVLIWSLVWKGIALWKAALKKHKAWFIIILIINTWGILEILYIFIFSKFGEKKTISNKSTKKKK